MQEIVALLDHYSNPSQVLNSRVRRLGIALALRDNTKHWKVGARLGERVNCRQASGSTRCIGLRELPRDGEVAGPFKIPFLAYYLSRLRGDFDDRRERNGMADRDLGPGTAVRVHSDDTESSSRAVREQSRSLQAQITVAEERQKLAVQNAIAAAKRDRERLHTLAVLVIGVALIIGAVLGYRFVR